MYARNPILDRFFESEFRPYRYKPVEFWRRILEIDPHEGQQRWLLNSTSPENALTTGNQFGKSFSAGGKLIWRGAYTKGWDAKVTALAKAGGQNWAGMNIGPVAEQSKIAWYKAKAMLSARRAQWLVKDVKFTPYPTITLFNDATITARSTAGDGDNLLGLTLDFINWDEAAREKKFEKIRDDVLRMRLAARRGMLDYTTTGNGRNDYGKYFLTGLPGDKKDPNLYSQTGSARDNPFIAVDLAKVAAGMSERMRRQNIEGHIIDAGGGFFAIDDLEAAISDELSRQMRSNLAEGEELSDIEIYFGRDVESAELGFPAGIPWHNQFPDHRYVHFWDLADKQDWCVGITLDTSGARLKAVEFARFTGKGWSYNFDRIRERHHRYAIGRVDDEMPAANSRTIVDSTGVGDVAADALKDINAEGFVFSKSSKDEVLAGLQAALSAREIDMPLIPTLYDECKFYERDDKALTQDCVMALAGAVHFGRRRPAPVFAFDF